MSTHRHVVRTIALSLVALLAAVGLAYFAFTQYAASQTKVVFGSGGTVPANAVVTYPNAKFAVMSDLHYYDTSLGTTGAAFARALGSDRKLLKESAQLVHLAVSDVIKAKVQFVLIPGDLTKDGELVDHQDMVRELARLKAAGIRAYVIPGNHDANNPGAVRYEGDQTVAVPNVSQQDFAKLYADDGYGKALYRDTDSLSYVAEPVKGLWLLAIDTTLSEKNTPGSEEIVGGRLTQEQADWIERMLRKAEAEHKAVICMSHHGTVEHWRGQAKLHPDYLVADYQQVGRTLASYGVRLAFTGHYHAQDITMGDFGANGFLYDIETGSLATAPSPIRLCTLRPHELQIDSRQLIGDLKPGTDFAEQANAFVRATVKTEAYNVARRYRVNEKDSNYIADTVAAAFVEHYRGDEKVQDKPSFDTGLLSPWGRFIWSQQRYVVDGLWQDLQPADNDVTLGLVTPGITR